MSSSNHPSAGSMLLQGRVSSIYFKKQCVSKSNTCLTPNPIIKGLSPASRIGWAKSMASRNPKSSNSSCRTSMGHVEDFHVKEHPLELTFGYIWNQKMELFFCVYVCVCVCASTRHLFVRPAGSLTCKIV